MKYFTPKHSVASDGPRKLAVLKVPSGKTCPIPFGVSVQSLPVSFMDFPKQGYESPAALENHENILHSDGIVRIQSDSSRYAAIPHHCVRFSDSAN